MSLPPETPTTPAAPVSDKIEAQSAIAMGATTASDARERASMQHGAASHPRPLAAGVRRSPPEHDRDQGG